MAGTLRETRYKSGCRQMTLRRVDDALRTSLSDNYIVREALGWISSAYDNTHCFAKSPHGRLR
jgi:hypothetical protein